MSRDSMAARSFSAAKHLWISNGLPASALSRLNLPPNANQSPNSSFRIGDAAQSSIGLAGLSAAHFHSLRTQIEQDVSVNARHAVLEFHSEGWYTLDGQLPGSVWDSIAGIYETRDGYVRIHTNFPHHRRGILNILEIPDSADVTRDQVQKSLRQWAAEDFESAAAGRGMCATAFRTFEQWTAHPQALALSQTPPVQIIKIGDAPRREGGGSFHHPLEGVRVLDLSRVLAGPICGRTLAAHGADVLLVTSPHLPDLPTLDVDTSRGKRTTQLDLNLEADRGKLKSLAADSDVFLQAYRPGGLEAKGFGADNLAELRPGIVIANLRAWGWDGPWKDRRAFDSLVQTATGFNETEGACFAEYSKSAFKPRPLPVQALDHAAGYLLAFGINAALCKTMTEGGSWEVRVSLAAVGRWLRSLGNLSPDDAFGPGTRPLPPQTVPSQREIADLSIGWVSADRKQKMTALKHAAILSKTPVREGEASQAPIVLNAHSAEWL
ncbi:unnamed protein product [Mycena citricolor]|uniref:CoA-transferase family III n=1 Tax=Mycena citricolor TaxID=2018698 RepID=A0AAD2HY58_9AGAR|nr:unnamed protein product [Mycena citricolor]